MKLALLFACFGLHAAFAWARFAVFRIDGRTPPGVRVIELAGTASALAGLAVLASQSAPPPIGPIWQWLALLIALVSAVMFVWALRSIRPRQLTAAFSSDRPTELLTRGAFGFCRNPFYLSYLLAHAVPWLASQSPWALPGLVLMAAIYLSAARREERKFLSSALAMDYRRYCRQVGRFLPRVAPRVMSGRARMRAGEQ